MHKEEHNISFFTESPDESVVLCGLTGLRANVMRRDNVAFNPHSSMSGGGCHVPCWRVPPENIPPKPTHEEFQDFTICVP